MQGSVLNASLSISSHQEVKPFPVGSGREAGLVHILLSSSALSLSLSMASTALSQPSWTGWSPEPHVGRDTRAERSRWFMFVLSSLREWRWMSPHCRREGHCPAVITAKGEQIVTNMGCGHSVWPLGTSTSLLHDRVCSGKIIPEDPACRGSLCSPTHSTCLAFTHMLLPGTSRRRGGAPPSLPRHHRLLLMCQQTWESSGYPPDRHPHLKRISGPTQRGIRFVRKSRNYKHEPKQENEASVGLNRNSKLRPLLWASAHSGLPIFISTCSHRKHILLPEHPESEGIQVFSHWLWCASLMPLSSLTGKKTWKQTTQKLDNGMGQCPKPL